MDMEKARARIAYASIAGGEDCNYTPALCRMVLGELTEEERRKEAALVLGRKLKGVGGEAALERAIREAEERVRRGARPGLWKSFQPERPETEGRRGERFVVVRRCREEERAGGAEYVVGFDDGAELAATPGEIFYSEDGDVRLYLEHIGDLPDPLVGEGSLADEDEDD